MKTIKGFEGEKLEVSDFGEWVGNDFIDYKFEYENNQKIIKILQQENQQLKNQLKEKLEASEKARKEAIEFINNINDWEICSKYDCMYKDDVLDVLRVLDIDKGE